MNPSLNQANGELFESTVRGEKSTESLSLTLSAARAAASSATGADGMNRTLTKEEKERKRRAKKRRQKREQRAVAAAEAAAEAAGINFTGTMKRNVAQEALKALNNGSDGDDYADDAFEADDEDENYSDDFEADASAAAARRKVARNNRAKGGNAAASSSSKPAFESVAIGADAGFEATIGGTRRSKQSKKSKKSAEKDSFGETYSRAGLPGRRRDPLDSEDDDHSLTLPASHHDRRVSGDEGPLPSVARAPSSGMPTARGHSPRSSPNTSHYQSDSNTGPLPNINRRR